MAEQKESSVLFSLKELMSLEEDRIKQEEDDRRRKEEAEQQARLDAERRAREAEEARMRGEEERRRQEEQRLREEQARVDAIRQAEIEKARHEAEQQARLRAMQQQQDHERQLVALSQDKQKKNLTYIAVGIGAVLVFGGVGGGYAFYSHAKEQERIQALKDEEIRQKEEQLNKLMADLKAQNDAVSQAQAEAANAKSDADRLAAQAKLAAAQENARKTQAKIAGVRGGGGKSGGGGGGGATPRPACTCQAGDPLCSCL